MTTTETNLDQRVQQLVRERCDQEPAELDNDTLLEDLGFDSLVLLELALKVRKEFGVNPTDDDLLLVSSVGDLADLVRGKLDEESG